MAHKNKAKNGEFLDDGEARGALDVVRRTLVRKCHFALNTFVELN
jgi:hypothetical protein